MPSFLTYFVALAASTGFPENSTLIAVTNGAGAVAGTTPEVDVTIEESTTAEQAADIWSALPDTATLTKGFSIPTYLPPFPDFIAADLPETTRTTTGLTMRHGTAPAGNGADTVSMPEFANKEQPQAPSQSQPNMRLHAYDSEKKEQQLRREKQLARERQLQPRHRLSLPPRNVTVQAGQHAYLPCQVSESVGVTQQRTGNRIVGLGMRETGVIERQQIKQQACSDWLCSSITAASALEQTALLGPFAR